MTCIAANESFPNFQHPLSILPQNIVHKPITLAATTHTIYNTVKYGDNMDKYLNAQIKKIMDASNRYVEDLWKKGDKSKEVFGFIWQRAQLISSTTVCQTIIRADGQHVSGVLRD